VRVSCNARAARLCATAMLWAGAGAAAQLPENLDDLSDRALYEASCASCHGVDGRGLDRALVAFEEQLPDFTDCNFASREPDADWIAIAHEGGPVRGFSQMMPAFRGALSEAQITRIIGYIRTLCGNPDWPRGELNLPRALLTEKAYPEDEWVVEADVALDGEGEVGNRFVYEKRFGKRSQIEVAIPWGWREATDPLSPGVTDWVGGLGDVVLGVKHAVYHDSEAGSILAFGGEVVLPTGDETKGLGAPGTKVEGFVSFGQILLSDAFLQVQTGIEAPLYDGAENELFGRALLGAGFTSGPWGRSWSPMLELQVKRDLESGAESAVDVVPQMQVSLNTRQHVLASLGVALPVTQTERSARLLLYVLLDWFDGGFFEGW